MNKLWDQNETSFRSRNLFLLQMRESNPTFSLKLVKQELNDQKEYQRKYGDVLEVIKRRESVKNENDAPEMIQRIVAMAQQLGGVKYRGIDYLEIMRTEGVI